MKSAFWNIVFALFFAFIVLTGVHMLYEEGLVFYSLPFFDFVLMGLAIFRLVRLVSYDVIFKFVRDWLQKAPKDSLLGTISALVSCPWCTGLWFAFFVVFFYYASPLAWPIILVLALAGVASLVQVFANLLGWHAEGKKREVLGGSNASGSTSTCG